MENKERSADEVLKDILDGFQGQIQAHWDILVRYDKTFKQIDEQFAIISKNMDIMNQHIKDEDEFRKLVSHSFSVVVRNLKKLEKSE